MVERDYRGDPLDFTWQDFQDRPYGGKGETVYTTETESNGDVEFRNVPEHKDYNSEKIKPVLDWLYAVSMNNPDEKALAEPKQKDDGTVVYEKPPDEFMRGYRMARYTTAMSTIEKIEEQFSESPFKNE